MREKRVLIVSYYWPPAGGPGVQRWLRFATHLPEHNWSPIIYTPKNPSYPIVDNALSEKVPRSLEIIKTKIWEPYRWAEKFHEGNKKYSKGQFNTGKKLDWRSKCSIFIRGNFFIPDARFFWVKPSIKFLNKYLRENDIDNIISTGPPHSMHLIGLGLKKKNPSLKWIADFRDPWTDLSYHQHLRLTKWAEKKHENMEREVFRKASIVLATSYTDAKNFEKKGAKAYCITNGFDDEITHSCREELSISPEEKEKFTVSYVGMLELSRNPEVLWSVLAKMKEENTDFSENLRIKFVGDIDQDILKEIKRQGLGQNLVLTGYLPHKDSLTEMKKSNLLLITSFPGGNSQGIIPGKLFGYLSCRIPILSLGPEKSEVSDILEETKAGKHFTFNDFEGIRSFISTSYRERKNLNNKTISSNIDMFSARSLTQKLVDVLNRLS